MFFTSPIFLFIFLPIFMAVYFIIPSKLKNITLVIFSIVFYSWGNFVFSGVIIALTLITFMLTIPINNRNRNQLKTLFFVINSLLFIVLFVGTIWIKLTNNYDFKVISLSYPVGLNFFILSGLSYVIDIYQNKCGREKNFVNFCVYLLMFPKLLGGPVVLYRDFSTRVGERNINFNKISKGVELFIIGMAKKVILADGITSLYAAIFKLDVAGISMVTSWIGAISALFALYFGLSGYVDMARGIAKILGFNLPINFRSPFSAVGIRDFFSRWDITVIGFFKEYSVYNFRIQKRYEFYTKVLIVSLLYAVFLGLSSGSVAAALYFFILISLEYLFIGKVMNKVPRLIRNVITFVFVMFGVVLYTAKSFTFGARYIGNMFFANKILYDSSSIYYFTSFIIILIICFFVSNRILKKYISKYRKKNRVLFLYLRKVSLIILFIISICYSMAEPFGSYMSIM